MKLEPALSTRMIEGSYPSIETLLPHRPPMLLIDRVIAHTSDRMTAAVELRPGAPFLVPGRGVPAHVGIEYMAQACAAFVGLEAVTAGLPVRPGYLLGTRHYRAAMAWLPEGASLTVMAMLLSRDSQMGVFDCHIVYEGQDIARAQLTVYQPEDAEHES